MNDSVFVDTAPYVGINYCGISWESAFLITQYFVYLYYNDTNLIRELYDQDIKWMEKAARIHPGGLVEEGLSDHESLEPVPVGLTGTCHYLQCARIMKTFAAVMNDKTREKQYGELADKLRDIVKKLYWDQAVRGKINRQTLFSTLLYHEIVPEKEIAAATDSLLNAVKSGPSGHLTTGIFGTLYALESLSSKASPGSVFKIVNSTSFPGWGHMIDKGATTIWETWKESDNTYSNCHPMFGSVTGWFYRWLGGIRPDPAFPGFREFTLAPSVPEGLEFVNCTYQSPYGRIVSNWKKEEGSIRYTMVIPTGSRAHVVLPLHSYQQIKLEKGDDPAPVKPAGLESGMFSLAEGEYLITVFIPENK
jgi:alpha-L-rhamnosidase